MLMIRDTKGKLFLLPHAMTMGGYPCILHLAPERRVQAALLNHTQAPRLTHTSAA